MAKDNLTLTGSLTITLIDEFGAIKYKDYVKNLIVSSGKNLLASLLSGNSSLFPNVMSIGTGTNAAIDSQTNLTTEVARVNFSTNTATGNITTFSATFPPGTGTGSLTEAGIFSGTLVANNGTMLSRTVFLPAPKLAGDTLNINWQITIN